MKNAKSITTKKQIIDLSRDSMNTAWRNQDGTITVETFHRYGKTTYAIYTSTKFNAWRKQIDAFKNR